MDAKDYTRQLKTDSARAWVQRCVGGEGKVPDGAEKVRPSAILGASTTTWRRRI
jgi:hypothetical protein